MFYDLLLADKSKEIIEQATFTDEGIFGFAAVVKSGDDDVRASHECRRIKNDDHDKKGNIEENLKRMMEIVRCVIES